jgi:peptide/nickel transport system permease protein
VALNPFVSTAGWLLPTLVSGSIIVAVVLSLPTTGPLLLQALTTQDMYLAGAFILLLSALTLIGTLVSDILLAWLDPRIRYE